MTCAQRASRKIVDGSDSGTLATAAEHPHANVTELSIRSTSAKCCGWSARVADRQTWTSALPQGLTGMPQIIADGFPWMPNAPSSLITRSASATDELYHALGDREAKGLHRAAIGALGNVPAASREHHDDVTTGSPQLLAAAGVHGHRIAALVDAAYRAAPARQGRAQLAVRVPVASEREVRRDTRQLAIERGLRPGSVGATVSLACGRPSMNERSSEGTFMRDAHAPTSRSGARRVRLSRRSIVA